MTGYTNLLASLPALSRQSVAESPAPATNDLQRCLTDARTTAPAIQQPMRANLIAAHELVLKMKEV